MKQPLSRVQTFTVAYMAAVTASLHGWYALVLLTVGLAWLTYDDWRTQR